MRAHDIIRALSIIFAILAWQMLSVCGPVVVAEMASQIAEDLSMSSTTMWWLVPLLYEHSLSILISVSNRLNATNLLVDTLYLQQPRDVNQSNRTIFGTLFLVLSTFADETQKYAQFYTAVNVLWIAGFFSSALASRSEPLIIGRILCAFGDGLSLPTSVSIIARVFVRPVWRLAALTAHAYTQTIGTCTGNALVIAYGENWRNVYWTLFAIALFLLLSQLFGAMQLNYTINMHTVKKDLLSNIFPYTKTMRAIAEDRDVKNAPWGQAILIGMSLGFIAETTTCLTLDDKVHEGK